MRCALLSVVLLSASVGAAPRLRERPPPADPEEARIKALKARHAEVRAPRNLAGADVGQLETAISLIMAEHEVRAALRKINRIEAMLPGIASEVERSVMRDLMRQVDEDARAGPNPFVGELLDIARYDRKKSAGEK